MKGFLPVGDGHSIYYEVLGPKTGKPFVYFHGGPGSSFSKRHQGLFNYRKNRVLFFDQRASGRSTYKDALRANTTQDLLRDTTRLMDFIGMKKATMVGGSWGSTLALLMGIIYPKRTNGIIAGSTFLADNDSIMHLFGGGISPFIPEAYEAFISLVPKQLQKNPISFVYQKIRAELRTKTKNPRFARELNLLECSAMNPTATRKELLAIWAEDPVQESVKSSAIECHYMAHKCFLRKDFILNHASTLARFPVKIIHGRHDLVCPIEGAYKLHKRIKGSQFVSVDAGHSSKTPCYTKALRKLINP